VPTPRLASTRAFTPNAAHVRKRGRMLVGGSADVKQRGKGGETERAGGGAAETGVSAPPRQEGQKALHRLCVAQQVHAQEASWGVRPARAHTHTHTHRHAHPVKRAWRHAGPPMPGVHPCVTSARHWCPLTGPTGHSPTQHKVRRWEQLPLHPCFSPAYLRAETNAGLPWRAHATEGRTSTAGRG
jgi:hypothetical protein